MKVLSKVPVSSSLTQSPRVPDVQVTSSTYSPETKCPSPSAAMRVLDDPHRARIILFTRVQTNAGMIVERCKMNHGDNLIYERGSGKEHRLMGQRRVNEVSLIVIAHAKPDRDPGCWILNRGVERVPWDWTGHRTHSANCGIARYHMRGELPDRVRPSCFG